MKLHNRFLKSLYSPASISKFKVLGVGSTIIYVLSLTFLCILPVLLLFLSNIFLNQSHQLNNFEKYGLNPDQMQNYASSMEGILPIVLFVVYGAMYILLSGILFSGVSILSGVGLPLSKILNKKLNYRQLWVISCYSITLPAILLTILFTLNVHIPFSFFFFWLFTFFIFFSAISKTPSK